MAAKAAEASVAAGSGAGGNLAADRPWIDRRGHDRCPRMEDRPVLMVKMSRAASRSTGLRRFGRLMDGPGRPRALAASGRR